MEDIHVNNQYNQAFSHLAQSVQYVGQNNVNSITELELAISALKEVEPILEINSNERDSVCRTISQIKRAMLNINSLGAVTGFEHDPRKLEFAMRRAHDIREDIENIAFNDLQKCGGPGSPSAYSSPSVPATISEPIPLTAKSLNATAKGLQVVEEDVNEDQDDSGPVIEVSANSPVKCDGSSTAEESASPFRSVNVALDPLSPLSMNRHRRTSVRVNSMSRRKSSCPTKPTGKSIRPSVALANGAILAIRNVASIFTRAPSKKPLQLKIPPANQIKWKDLHVRVEDATNAAFSLGSFGTVVKAVWNPDIETNPKAGITVAIRLLGPRTDPDGDEFRNSHNMPSPATISEVEKSVRRAEIEFTHWKQVEERLADREVLAKCFGIASGPLTQTLYRAFGHPDCEVAYGLVMRYEPGGCLSEMVQRYSVPIAEKLHILSSVAGAMLELHSAGIIHGDLQQGNVLLSGDAFSVSSSGAHAKSLQTSSAHVLSKARLARCASWVKQTRRPSLRQRVFSLSLLPSLASTALWISPDFNAPEILPPTSLPDNSHTHAIGQAIGTRSHLATYSAKSDIYSFAILCWEVLTERQAFSGYNSESDVLAAVQRGERPSLSQLPLSCPARVRWLIEQCWSQDPALRRSSNECTAVLLNYSQLAAGSLCDVFLSFQSDDCPSFACAIMMRLTLRGYRVFFDRMNAEIDTAYSQRGVGGSVGATGAADGSGAADCRLFLFMASQKYQSDKACMQQLRDAKLAGRRTVPLIVESRWWDWSNNQLHFLVGTRSPGLLHGDFTDIAYLPCWSEDLPPPGVLSLVDTTLDALTHDLSPLYTMRQEDRHSLRLSRSQSINRDSFNGDSMRVNSLLQSHFARVARSSKFAFPLYATTAASASHRPSISERESNISGSSRVSTSGSVSSAAPPNGLSLNLNGAWQNLIKESNAPSNQNHNYSRLGHASLNNSNLSGGVNSYSAHICSSRSLQCFSERAMESFDEVDHDKNNNKRKSLQHVTSPSFTKHPLPSPRQCINSVGQAQLCASISDKGLRTQPTNSINPHPTTIETSRDISFCSDLTSEYRLSLSSATVDSAYIAGPVSSPPSPTRNYSMSHSNSYTQLNMNFNNQSSQYNHSPTRRRNDLSMSLFSRVSGTSSQSTSAHPSPTRLSPTKETMTLSLSHMTFNESFNAAAAPTPSPRQGTPRTPRVASGYVNPFAAESNKAEETL